MRWKWLIGASAAVIVAASVIVGSVKDSGYELEILMPSADGAFPGAIVTINGEDAGKVTEIGVRGNKAFVRAQVDGDKAPLHAGTTARISWRAIIGTRVVELLPGPKQNPPLPSGRMITSNVERVEPDDVLEALDAPTRARLQGVIGKLQQTLSGREQQLNATLRAAGPTGDALGEVMRAVGDDGPAIRQLIHQLHSITSELAVRQGDLGQTVEELGQLTSATAGKQERLKATLGELPSTIDEANRTLDRVPQAVDATVPLLRDVQPAAARIPSVSRKLNPVLRDLGPTVGMLRPTLGSAQSLLRHTPGLLDTAHDTVPGLTDAVNQLEPAVAFLRPYTPELTGWLTNWASIWGSENSSGNYARPLITVSASSFNDNPGLVPPGLKQSNRASPGEPAGQPWTDANGDGMR